MKKLLTIRPFKRGHIRSGIHYISFEVYGNPKGHPWMFCHGGPGYHCVPSSNLQNFNLKKDMIILFDQRGSGKSTPATELKFNTTNHLVSDMNSILEYLKVPKVNLLGGSWGSTLALVFGIKYPKKVKSMILRGVFLGRKQDVWQIYKPNKLWSQNQKEKFDLTLGVIKRKFNIKNFLTDGAKILKKNDQYSLTFSKLWAAYEDLICTKSWKIIDYDNQYLKMAMDISSIEIHYFKNNCFLPKNYILRNAKKLKDIKIQLVQGGEDMVCPPNQARQLLTALDKGNLYIDPIGGHSSTKRMNKIIKNKVRQFGRIK